MRRKSELLHSDSVKELWINPRSNLRGPDGNRGWDLGGNIAPTSGARFLELADVALGLKKPSLSSRKKRATGTAGHVQPANGKQKSHTG